jgi:colanic acid/amylovoran biosynthesis glycosyltransferase
MRHWQPILAGRQSVPFGLDVDDLLVTQGVPELSTFERRRQQMSRRVPNLAEIVAETSPDLIHAHFLTGGLDVMASLQQLPCPLVVTGHGFDVTFYGSPRHTLNPGQWLLGRYRHQLLRHPEIRFIGVSRFIAGELLRLGAKQDRVVVHHTGVDTGYFRPLSSDCVVGSQPRGGIVFVGRLVPKKGAADLLEALAILKQEGLSPSLTVIGDGPERKRLQRLAKKHGLDVRFCGVLPREAVREIVGQASLLCGPSRTAPNGDREGLGMVFIEAQAMSVPVVATRSGGIPDAVDDGQTGMLANEGDVFGLAACLRNCLKDVELYSHLRSAARPWVEQNFDLTTQTQKLEQLYDSWSM